MRAIQRRLTAILLSFCILIGAAPVSYAAAETGDAAQGSGTEEFYSINPLYADVISEADLKPVTGGGISAYTDSTADMTLEEAGASMRAEMVNRSEKITVRFKSTDSTAEAANAVFDEAVKHTGEGNEGDYLRWQYAGYRCSATYTLTDGVYSYAMTFSMTYYTTAEQEASVDAAVEALLDSLDLTGKSTYLRAKAIYETVCETVTYDYDNLEDTSYTLKYTAFGALINGTAVCQGYAVLLYRLFLEEGIDCRLITGESGGPHAWNIAKVGKLYYNLDATFDSNLYFSQGELYDYFFLRGAGGVFDLGDGSGNLPAHVRDAEYDTDEFHAAYPMSDSDYVLEEHEHIYEAESVTDPTCTEQGYTVFACTVCGESYVGDYTEATGHSYEGEVTAPTCTEGGYTTYTCTVCGDSYVGNNTDATGHSYEGEVTAPTCTEEGYTTYTCTVCGDSYVGNNTDAAGHSYEGEVTAPTCTEQGYTTYTCTVCGDSYVGNNTDAAGHSYESEVTAPTCTEEGYTTYTCTVCGESEVGDYTEAAGHSYEAGLVTAPTCTEQGYTTYTCTVCGDSYVDDYTEATGHSYEAGSVTAPTCTEQGYTTYICTVCGESKVGDYTEAMGHSYESEVTAPTCTEQGYTTYTCTVCGESYVADYTEAAGHRWDDGTVTAAPTESEAGEAVYTCVVCGTTRTEELPATGVVTKENPFEDVTESDWFYEYVLWAYENNVVVGIDSTHFAPRRACTRAEIVQILYNQAGKPEVPEGTANPFADVTPGDWYYDAVLWAAANGITSGVDETHFAPSQLCTRSQIVQLLYAKEGRPPVSEDAVNPFVDVAPTAWYYSAVLWASAEKITSGTDASHFSPGASCSRAEAVTFLNHVILR